MRPKGAWQPILFCDIMAKNNLTSEMLEMILTKVTDKLTEAFKLLIDQVVTTLNARMDNIEKTVLTELQKQKANPGVDAETASGTIIPTNSGFNIKDDQSATVRTLLAMETEKAERVKRSCNIIVSGMPSSDDIHDADLFSEFCEEHLTVKPLPVRESCLRLGKNADNRTAKLRITLSSAQAVDDLIQSSAILRKSEHPAVRGIYFNRDLTAMEAQVAYEQRTKQRTKKRNKNTSSDGSASGSDGSASGSDIKQP